MERAHHLRAGCQLVLGVHAHKSGNHGSALALFKPDDSLRVVALYYNYKSYRDLGQGTIAESILAEMQLLFASSA